MYIIIQAHTVSVTGRRSSNWLVSGWLCGYIVCQQVTMYKTIITEKHY